MTVAGVAQGGVGRSRAGRDRVQTYLFFYPALALVACVSFLPMFYAFRQSLYAANHLQIGGYVGLANFSALFFGDTGFAAIRASILFAAGTVILSVPLGVGLALLLHAPMPGRDVFRTILMLPWVVSQMVTALLWLWFYDGRLGPLSPLFEGIGLYGTNPLTDLTLAMPALVLANVWPSYPLVMVFALASLQTVPGEVVEAARIDCPSAWRRFWHVTLPLIRPTLIVAVVLTTLHSFNNVTLVLMLTGGGPVGETATLALRVFKEGFQFYRMEIASACAVVIFCLNMAFTLAYVRALRGERTA